MLRLALQNHLLLVSSDAEQKLAKLCLLFGGGLHRLSCVLLLLLLDLDLQLVQGTELELHLGLHRQHLLLLLAQHLR